MFGVCECTFSPWFWYLASFAPRVHVERTSAYSHSLADGLMYLNFFSFFVQIFLENIIFYLWWTLVLFVEANENDDGSERMKCSGAERIFSIFFFFFFFFGKKLREIQTNARINWSIVVRKIKLFSSSEWKNAVWIVETHAGTRLAFCSLYFISFYLIFVLWSFYTTSCLVFKHRAQRRRRRRRGGKTKNEYTKHVRCTRNAFRFQKCCVLLVVVRAQCQRSFV